MAKVNGLKALFSGSSIRRVIEKKAKEYDKKIILTLQFIGETFVNEARLNGNYTDRTGNLRSSIGYVILKDGNIIKSNFSGAREGVERGKSFAGELANDYSQGYVLIGVAGMEYAAYVEARNYDVITGSAPTTEILKSILNEVNF